MKRQLNEMTLSELWELFPIVLKEYNPKYPEWYAEERDRIEKIVGGENIFRISHIGSTAVRGLLSKPTVDILLELPEATPHGDGSVNAVNLADALKKEWILMSEQREPLKLVFNKGYTPNGFAERVFHLHVRRIGDWDELYFRDYLSEHADAVAEYAALKRSLQSEFAHDRDGYTAAKTNFVKEITQKARALYGDRYSPHR